MALTATSEGWSHWPAPAKLNLFLRITGRRADGYHLLQSAFMLIDWCDTLHFELRPPVDAADSPENVESSHSLLREGVRPKQLEDAGVGGTP